MARWDACRLVFDHYLSPLQDRMETSNHQELTYQRTPGNVFGFGLRTFRHACRLHGMSERKLQIETALVGYAGWTRVSFGQQSLILELVSELSLMLTMMSEAQWRERKERGLCEGLWGSALSYPRPPSGIRCRGK